MIGNKKWNVCPVNKYLFARLQLVFTDFVFVDNFKLKIK